ncbi:ABC transporter ATP-binding protein [Martelella radicis]|uniref:Multiple sugar transport system ATP-binding protein/lactose/L-arabinose transport system ATP-binding protein n=1 Tax=Martelella radicis TaxID=1397476 RepID=A0A7W6KL04_9HYPH|nr:sn-glycerol-3-phosphate ABC transporter ATP-binding protein UgpC [Martelella radicis]MBB4123196.1 multiple sugar transport system ATP-binding protein/lactose/L-arabinose transport system ATP-binding protein [Martelella radicis]
MADVKLDRVVKRFGELETIHGVDLDIESGSFVVFVGPSGCGKSTLLRMIAGLEEVTEGDVYIGGKCVTEAKASARGIGMVFQSYALYPHMTVRENMSFGLEVAGEPKEVIAARVSEAAEILKLGELLDRKPRQLSGGQRQRVAIGRTIVRQPKVFLFDEPLSNLDAELRVQMRIEITRLHERLGNTMIYVTHDQVEAMTMADTIVVLRDGAVEQVGTPLTLYHRPENRFVAGFIGSPKMNFLPVRVKSVAGDSFTITLPDGRDISLSAPGQLPSHGDMLELGIRPEHFIVGKGGDFEVMLHCDVVEELGGTTYVYGEYDGRQLIVEGDGDMRIQRGKDELFSFDRDRLHLFDDKGRAVMLQRDTDPPAGGCNSVATVVPAS